MKNAQSVESSGTFITALIVVLKALLITAAALLLLTAFVALCGMPEGVIIPCARAATFLCVFSAGLFTSRKMRRGGYLSGIVSGLIYFVVMLILSFVLLGKFEIGANTLKMLVISVVAGVIGGITGVNLKRKKKYF